jgi:hypothetical protein
METPSRPITPPRIFTIYAVQYYRGRLPWHWAIALLWDVNKEKGITSVLAYDVIGSIDNYRYNGGCYPCDLEASQTYRGVVAIGSLPERDVDRFNEALRTIEIKQHMEDWDCQKWVLTAIRRLQANGWVPAHVAESWLREQLETVYPRYQKKGDECGPK